MLRIFKKIQNHKHKHTKHKKSSIYIASSISLCDVHLSSGTNRAAASQAGVACRLWVARAQQREVRAADLNGAAVVSGGQEDGV